MAWKTFQFDNHIRLNIFYLIQGLLEPAHLCNEQSFIFQRLWNSALIFNSIQTFFILDLLHLLIAATSNIIWSFVVKPKQGGMVRTHPLPSTDHNFCPQISVYGPLPSTFHPHDTLAHEWAKNEKALHCIRQWNTQFQFLVKFQGHKHYRFLLFLHFCGRVLRSQK